MHACALALSNCEWMKQNEPLYSNRERAHTNTHSRTMRITVYTMLIYIRTAERDVCAQCEARGLHVWVDIRVAYIYTNYIHTHTHKHIAMLCILFAVYNWEMCWSSLRSMLVDVYFSEQQFSDFTKAKVLTTRFLFCSVCRRSRCIWSTVYNINSRSFVGVCLLSRGGIAESIAHRSYVFIYICGVLAFKWITRSIGQTHTYT